jgi:hypothetical protein
VANDNQRLGESRESTTAIDAVPFSFRRFLRDGIYQREIERHQFGLKNGSDLAANPNIDLVSTWLKNSLTTVKSLW